MFTYDPLWKLLIDKKLKKSDLVFNIPISSTTLAKMSKNEYVDMKTLEKICNYLQCNIEDIIQFIPN